MTRREVLSLAGSVVFLGAKSPQFARKAVIRTVLKDLPPEALGGGATLFHEHMSFSADFMPKLLSLMRAQAGRGAGPAPAAQTGQKYFMQDIDLMVEEISTARKEGVACLVDGGHADMGRSLDFLKQLSKLSGMPIVASAGYYTSPFYPPEIGTMSEDQIAEELIRQVHAEPIGAFGEIGSSDQITADERKVFRAVAKAHLATNLPIFTHTAFGKAAVEQLDIFESMGVKPQRVVIGHLGGLVDPKVEVHKAICKRGAFVGFDRQGGPGDAAQVPMVMALIEAGYADNLMFASDFSSAAQLKRNAGGGYAKTVTVFAPKLRQAGAQRRDATRNPGRQSAPVSGFRSKETQKREGGEGLGRSPRAAATQVIVHRRRDDQRQHHRRDQAADHGDRQRLQHLRTGADGERQRNHAGDGRQRGHQNRPQPALAGLDHGVARRRSFGAEALIGIEQQDAVLRHDADHHDQSHERRDVEGGAGDQERQETRPRWRAARMRESPSARRRCGTRTAAR